MIISVTERAVFKRCERMWDYSSFNRQALTPIRTAPALDLGSLVHKSLADWIVARRYTDDEAQRLEKPELKDEPMPLVEAFKFHARARLDEIDKHNARLGRVPTVEEETPLLRAMELGIAMMENYQNFYGTPVPKNMSFVAPEQKVRVPIPNTICEKCSGTESIVDPTITDDYPVFTCDSCDGTGNHVLEGTLDAFLQDELGRLYILEHKTFTYTPKLEVLSRMDQFIAYIWLATKLNIGPVAGIAYDGMQKRSVPVKGKGMDSLFLRTILKRSKNELEEFEIHLAHEATRMANVSFLTFNRTWKGCDDCMFVSLCEAQSLGHNLEAVKSKHYTNREPQEVLGVAEEVA